MQTLRVLSVLTFLVGLVLAVTPWFLHFRSDHVAFLDVAVGGIVVAVLGLVTYMVGMAGPRPHSSH